MPYIFLVLIAICCFVPPATWGDSPDNFHLTVLHTNDFHGVDYSALAREATLIKRIRSEEPHLLYLEAGDTFARGPYHRKFYGALEFAVLNALNCDAMALGNNEFKATNSKDSSLSHLSARIAQANFPVLCANVKIVKDGTYLPKVQPYHIKIIDGIKIGLIGVTSDRIMDYPQLDGFLVEDPIRTFQNLFPQVASESDFVLALTHIGFGSDRLLAARVRGLGAVIGGDSHTALANPFNEKNIPIVQAGSNGRYLGRLDLYFEKQNSVWVLTQFKGELLPITREIPEDPEIRGIIDRFMDSLNKEAA